MLQTQVYCHSKIFQGSFSIQIIPSQSQFFSYEDITLSCEVSAGGGRLKRNTTARGSESCPYGWGTLTGSTCTITTMYPSDTGFYWSGPVILESPVLPVKEGEAVTLRCRNRKMFSNLTANFYKDGVVIGSSFTGDMTIHSVLKSDEGLYKCKISDIGESPESWLTVKVSDPAVPDAPDGAPLVSVCRLISLAVVGTPYLLSTIILGLIYRDKRRARQLVAEDRSHAVVMEME
eukprot:superscaffoldBa00006677_g21785